MKNENNTQTSMLPSQQLLGHLSKDELIQMNYQLLIRLQEQSEQIKQQNYRFPLFYPTTAPTRSKRHNSLPNSSVASCNTSPTLTPTIYENDSDDENSGIQEVEEAFYVTLIDELEKTKSKQSREITELNKEIRSLENRVINLQDQENERKKDLEKLKKINSQLLKDKTKLEEDKIKVENELELTTEDFIERSQEVEKLHQELLEEIKVNELLEQRLSDENKASQEFQNELQTLTNQITQLNHDKELLDREKKWLKQSIEEQSRKYQIEWEQREKMHLKQIDNYRIFGALDKEEILGKKRSFDFSNLSDSELSSHRNHFRTRSLDLSRPSSISLLNKRNSKLNLELELSLSPKTPNKINEKGNFFGDDFSDTPEQEAIDPFNILMNDIGEYEKENQTKAITEMEKEIENNRLNEELTELKRQKQQQEKAVQDLLQENILLKEQNKGLEKKVYELHQINLQKGLENEVHIENLKEKDFWLQSGEEKKAKFLNFTKNLEEVFPLNEKQEASLKEVQEPEVTRLLYLKTNIFGGVNKFKKELEELKEDKAKQEEIVRDIVQELILLKERVKNDDDLTNQIKELEKSLYQLNQTNLKQGMDNVEYIEQLKEKDFWLQMTESKKIKILSLIRGLEETFPLAKYQQEALEKVEEPELARLFYLKSNVFRGVNKLRGEKVRLGDEIEVLKKENEQLEKGVDLSTLKNTIDEFKELQNQIEITIYKK